MDEESLRGTEKLWCLCVGGLEPDFAIAFLVYNRPHLA